VSAVQLGATIARRYVLEAEEDYDLPGVRRFRARDTRLAATVSVDLITAQAPMAVLINASQARVVRDKRLTRVLASGTHVAADATHPFVVTERPAGVALDLLVGHVAMIPTVAAAVVGEAASALATAAQVGVHHGAIRAQALTVTTGGRVMLAGLGLDGELISQARQGHGRSERADAQALGVLFVEAVTGKDAADVVLEDLPEDLTPAALQLAQATLAGRGPTTLAAVTGALGHGNTAVLRAMAQEAPSLWWPDSTLLAPVVDVEAVEADEPEPADIALTEAEPTDAEPSDTEPTDAAVHHGADTHHGATASARPRTFFGAVDDLDEFRDIVAAQNVTRKPTRMERFLGRLHTLFPGSAPLARALESAHARAQRPAPLNAGPLVVGIMVTLVFVAAVVALSTIGTTVEPTYDRHNNPINTYPEYTYSPTPAPSGDGAEAGTA